MIGIYYSLLIDYKIILGIRGLTAHRFTKQDNHEKRCYFLELKPTHCIVTQPCLLEYLLISLKNFLYCHTPNTIISKLQQ